MTSITPLTGGFSPPDINDDDIAEVVSALKSGWITTGPKTKEFERQVACDRIFCETQSRSWQEGLWCVGVPLPGWNL